MSTDGSARAFGVGACARLIPTLGGPGEASGPRTDGFHWLGYPRTPPRHSGARPRRPLWVAVMACLWGDVLSKKNPGDTGPRRQQEFHWRDHGLGSSHTANLKITAFTPQFSPYRSLWTSGEAKGVPTTRQAHEKNGFFTHLKWARLPRAVADTRNELPRAV